MTTSVHPTQPVGTRAAAVFRRMERNDSPRLRICPAETPVQTVMGWVDENGIPASDELVTELCRRLRDSRMLFEEDGGLCGSSIVDALREQAKLLPAENWDNAQKLRSLAEHVQTALGQMGLL